MIFEHEIPSNSRLYFGQSAKLKRSIEQNSAAILEELGFSEISTPLFSYHQHNIFNDSRVLIRLNDANNAQVSLRADSTVDVVRIATKRLSRSENIKKWFYIQPIFTYPTTEVHQIGAEVIDGSVDEVANISIKLLNEQSLKYSFQLANIAIAQILVSNYGFDLDDIKNIRLEKILNSKYSWIDNLVNIESVSDLEDLSLFPQDIETELSKLKESATLIDNRDILISPLYYAPMRYYNSLVFRAFDGEKLYATGGIYKIQDVDGAGFAIYTDTIIANKMAKEIDE